MIYIVNLHIHMMDLTIWEYSDIHVQPYRQTEVKKIIKKRVREMNLENKIENGAK